MSRTTLGRARADESGIAYVLNTCPTDARVVSYINQAQLRLLPKGKWWNTYQKYRICTSDGCLTWPRQIAAIEAMSVCNHPVTLRNEWFEFIESGYGLRNGESCDMQGFGRAEGTGACSFEDMASNGSEKIKVYADVAEAVGARILLRGHDENGNWIRTQDSGVWIDGEYVSINSATPQTSTHYFSSLANVIKPVTNGSVRLYKINPATVAQKAMAIYEWDEENPNYRRTFIGSSLSGTSSTGCTTKAVTVMAKMEFIPARNDNDYLLIGCLPALKLACMSIKKQEDNLFAESEILMEGRLDRDGKRHGGAVQELENELSHYLGSGNIQPVNFESRETWGAAVCNVI